jgi:c-di-GMP-related signal transduction protein
VGVSVEGWSPVGIHAVHVGRQPVYDARGHLVGYELLFRSGADATGASSDGAYATSRVLVNACTEFGLERLTGGRLAFVNLTREFLVGELPIPFEPGQAVLEILETVPVDAAVVAGVASLVARGFEVALDDYVPDTPADRLLDLARYVKIDVLGVPVSDVARTLRRCRSHAGHRFLAERVETPNAVATAARLGFTLFQGYALGRPQVITARRLDPAGLPTLRLLATLADPTSSVRDVARLVEADAALCYRLLTAANSAAAMTGQRITSITQAAVLVGVDRLRQWLTLMSLADLVGDEHHATAAVAHARFCQEIATGLGLPAGQAFTVGLLDAVCDLVGEGPAELVTHVPLTIELASALTARQGPLGGVLDAARGYYAAGDRSAELSTAYLAALAWSHDLTHPGTPVGGRA